MEILFKRGTTAANNSYTGALGSISIDLTLMQLRLHDGNTIGGVVVGENAITLDGQTKAFYTNATNLISGTLPTARLSGTYTINVSGNATTATSLATARTINGTSFNGTANITTANWGTARTLSFTGDVTGSASVNGSGNVAFAMTLASSGVSAGTYKSVTVDTKGRVTAGADVLTGLITSSTATGTSNVATTNANTFLNITEKVGTATASAGTSTQITGAGTVTIASDTAGKITITGAQSITGNAATATKLATARTLTIGATGKTFDGSANVAWSLTELGLGNINNTSDADKPVSTLQQDALNLKADTSTQVIAGTGLTGGGTLAANRTLSVSYGTAAGTAAQGNDARLSDSREWTAAVVTQAEAEAGTATTARKWTAQRVRQAILGWWNGSADKTKLDGIEAGAQVNSVTSVAGKTGAVTLTHTDVNAAPTSHAHSLSQITDAGNLASLSTNASTANFLRGDGTWVTPPNTNTTYTEITTAEIDAGTATTLRTITGRRVKYALDKKADVSHTHTLSQITDAGSVAGISTNGSAANFLRGDGTWATPPNTNTTYSAGTGITLTGTTFSLADERFTSALSTKLGGIAAGATANSTDAQLRARSTHTGTQAMSTVDGLDSALGGKVDSTDSRLSDSREWTATVVTQAEAQAGTSTTARKWTAQRVAQAISALGLSIGTTATTAKAGNWTPTWSEVSGKPTTFAPSAHTHSLSQITDAGSVASLSTTGSTTAFLRGDGTWATPPNTNTTYSEITTAEIDAGTASTARAISGRRMQYALDKKADTVHGHSISDVTGLQTGLDSKVDKTTSVVAGTGLSGGGTLAANRTLSVNYGTAAGTAAQGNDARLSDSREWTAAVVSQAEAEAGTVTTARKWTAQRVAQAISALGLKIGTTASTAKAGNWTPTWSEVSGKPTTFTPASHTHALAQITDAGNLAALNTNASTANFLRGDGTWVTPPNTNTTYTEITTAEIDAGTASTLRTITGRRIKYAVDTHGLKIGTTSSTAKAGNWTPTWSEVTSKPTTFTPAAHNHSAGEITSGVLAYARIPTIRHGDTDFANQALNTGSSVQHATVRTGGAVNDGTNSLQVAGGTRTDTLAAGGVQVAEESIDTNGNVQVRGEGQLKMGDFAIQYNAATKSLDFNWIGG